MRQAVMTLAGFAIVAPLAFLFSFESSNKSSPGTPRNGFASGPVTSVNARESTLLRTERPFTFRVPDYPARQDANQTQTVPPEEPVVVAEEPESDPEAEAAFDAAIPFYAGALFELLDVNGDGQLTADELPTVLRLQLSKDASLDSPAFAAYFQVAVFQAELTRGASLNAFRSAAAMPSFESLDTDGDGQVGLYEWRAAGRSLAEFRRLDTDGDGLLTRREMQVEMPLRASSFSTPVFAKVDGSNPIGVANLPVPLIGPTLSSKTLSQADSLFAGVVSLAAKVKPAAAPPNSTVVAQASPSPAPKRVARGRPPAPKAAQPATSAVMATPTPAPVAASPAPAPPAPVSLDALASVSLPLTGNAHWEQRDLKNCTDLMLGMRPNVLFLGDSITELLESGAGQPLWANYFAPLGSLDFGVGGITTSQVLWQIERGEVAVANPKVVVLMIGINNLSASQSPRAVAGGIAKIVAELNAQLPHTRILLVGVLPRGTSPTDPYRSLVARTNALIAPLADGNRVTFINVGPGMLSPDGSLSPVIMPDTVHPSVWGYQIYTAGVWPVLVDLLHRP